VTIKKPKTTFAIFKGIKKYKESLNRPKKRNVTLYLDEELVNKAKSLGINLSTLTESVVRTYISEIKRKRVK